jgi:uncharacterized protein YprB with RNaseH-like and TPR domain
MSKEVLKAMKFLNEKPGYKKSSPTIIASKIGVNIKSVIKAKSQLKNNTVENVENVVKKNSNGFKKKRLFFDIETSPNVVLSWNVGYKINLSYDNIIKERAIICICYKWEGEDKTYGITWNDGDDYELLSKFITIANTADEIVAHNGDNFDIKWLRARAIKHGLIMRPKYDSIDTLKLSRSGFRFNSNRLDYLGKYLGLKGKTETNYDLWKDIILKNDKKALNLMVDYCKRDVELLEKVHAKLNPYVKHKYNYAVANEKPKCNCPECGSDNYIKAGIRVSAAGTRQQKIQCLDCYKFYSIDLNVFNNLLK